MCESGLLPSISHAVLVAAVFLPVDVSSAIVSLFPSLPFDLLSALLSVAPWMKGVRDCGPVNSVLWDAEGRVLPYLSSPAPPVRSWRPRLLLPLLSSRLLPLSLCWGVSGLSLCFFSPTSPPPLVWRCPECPLYPSGQSWLEWRHYNQLSIMFVIGCKLVLLTSFQPVFPHWDTFVLAFADISRRWTLTHTKNITFRKIFIFLSLTDPLICSLMHYFLNSLPPPLPCSVHSVFCLSAAAYCGLLTAARQYQPECSRPQIPTLDLEQWYQEVMAAVESSQICPPPPLPAKPLSTRRPMQVILRGAAFSFLFLPSSIVSVLSSHENGFSKCIVLCWLI